VHDKVEVMAEETVVHRERPPQDVGTPDCEGGRISAHDPYHPAHRQDSEEELPSSETLIITRKLP
jgi:hypothetical protein